MDDDHARPTIQASATPVLASTSAKRVSFALDGDGPSAPRLKQTHKNKGPTPLERLLARQTGSDHTGSSAKPKASKKTMKVVSLSTVEKQEDDEIAWLEAKLGMSKGKKKRSDKKNPVDEDGLDGWLDRRNGQMT